MTELTRITSSDVDRDLLAELGGSTDGVELFVAPYDAATVANQHYQVAYHEEAGRAGVVFRGSGSSGAVTWVDCVSAEDGFERFLAERDQVPPGPH